MTNAAPKAIAISKALDDVMHNDRGRLLAGLISRLGDFQTAEDALQDASISALGHWGRSGIPHSPMAWLMKVALNKGIDRFRSNSRETRKSEDYRYVSLQYSEHDDPEEIPDERLRLIFACCHPALDEKSRVALTLRTVCNLTTLEIANSFLDAEPTMGQRLSRAITKIKTKGIAFSVPEAEQLPERLGTVLSTIYLIFTTGYVAQDNGARDLCKEALFLTRLLDRLRPRSPEIEGALALMLLTNARGSARVGDDGASVPISEQNRTLWNDAFIAEGQTLLSTAMSRRSPGPFQLKAAIADCHMLYPAPDWLQMSLLYQSLWKHEPTPVVTLNWAAVLAELDHADLALEKLNALHDDLSHFQPWHAARADILAKLGKLNEATDAYAHAIQEAPHSSDKIFLQKKLSLIAKMNH